MQDVDETNASRSLTRGTTSFSPSQRVIDANPELRERELIKLASYASAMTDALRRRGVADSTASLTAEAGITVFRVAFDRWHREGNRRELPKLIRESLDELPLCY